MRPARTSRNVIPLRPGLRTAPASLPAASECRMPQTSHVPAYLEWMRQKGCSPETIATRRRFFTRTQRALGCPADHATAEQLRYWRAALTITPRAIERYISHLRAYYQWCCDEGLRGDNPARRLPVPRSGRLLPRPIAERDLAEAVDSAPRDMRLILILSAWCGLRACEIAGLLREHILDTAPEPVIIVAETAAKGGRERAVSLCPFVLGELDAFGLPSWGPVLRRRDGRPGPVRPARVSQMAGDHLRARGIRAVLHQGRHRFATEALAACGDLRQVQELLGHASVASTQIYTAVRPAGAAKVVAALPVPLRLRAAG